MTDFRQALAALVNDAKDLHKRERAITIESVLLIGTLDVARAHIQLGMTRDAFAVYIELTPSVYGKRAQAARIMRRFPAVMGMLERGETSISHVAAVAGKMTGANAHLIIPALAEKSKHQLEAYLSRITPYGDLLPQEGQVEVKVRLTESELALLTRAREVLAANGHVPSNAEIFKTALGDLLAKRDKLARAERAKAKDELRARAAEVEAPGQIAPQVSVEFSQVDINLTARTTEVDAPGQTAPRVDPAFPQSDNLTAGEAEVDALGQMATGVETRKFSPVDLAAPSAPRASGQGTPRYYANRPREPIGARARHAVWHRDQGRCTELLADGSRCPELSMLEIDHIQLWCRGGTNKLENLALRCRQHNRHRAEALLGARYMDRWKRNPSQGSPSDFSRSVPD